MARYQRKKGFSLTSWLFMGGLLVAGALFKSKVLGVVKKVPMLENIDEQIGDDAV